MQSTVIVTPYLAAAASSGEGNHLMELQGRSAIVTGGAGGLGAATVRRLVDIGVRVAVFDLDADRAGQLAKELG